MTNRHSSKRTIQMMAAAAMAVALLLNLAACAEKDYLDGLENSYWLGSGENPTSTWCMSFGEDRLLQLISYDSNTNEASYSYGIYNLMRGKKVRTLFRLVDKEQYEAAIKDWRLENWDKSKFAQELSWVITELSDDRFVWVSKGLLRQGDGRVSGENEDRNEYVRVDSCDNFIADIPDDAKILTPGALN